MTERIHHRTVPFLVVGRVGIADPLPARLSSDGFVLQDYRLMAESLVRMGAADGEVDLQSFAGDIERVIERLGSMEAQLDTTAVIDESTGTVTVGSSVNFDQEVWWMAVTVHRESWRRLGCRVSLGFSILGSVRGWMPMRFRGFRRSAKACVVGGRNNHAGASIPLGFVEPRKAFLSTAQRP